MSTTKKKLGIGDRLDKYRAHLLHNEELSDFEADMLVKYRRANALMCQGYSRMRTITLITKECGISTPQAYRILKDSIEIFGDVNKADKEGLRYIMYENFMQASNLAKKNKDYQGMIRALENASKIYDLYTQTEEGIDPTQFIKPAEIYFTTDAKVLLEQQASETEDTDYEEAE